MNVLSTCEGKTMNLLNFKDFLQFNEMPFYRNIQEESHPALDSGLPSTVTSREVFQFKRFELQQQHCQR